MLTTIRCRSFRLFSPPVRAPFCPIPRSMPEARAASSKGKRKAPPSEHDAESSPSDSKAEGSQPQTATERPSVSRKKSKTVSSTSIDTTKKGKSVEIAPPANGMPTNTKLPDKIEFARPAEGSFRIASWNVCKSYGWGLTKEGAL